MPPTGLVRSPKYMHPYPSLYITHRMTGASILDIVRRLDELEKIEVTGQMKEIGEIHADIKTTRLGSSATDFLACLASENRE